MHTSDAPLTPPGPESVCPGTFVFTSSVWQMRSPTLFFGQATLLVDPGYFPAELVQIRAFLAARGRTEDHLTLLYTHGDFDHILGATEWPGVPSIGAAALTRRDGHATLARLAEFDAPLYVPRPQAPHFPVPARLVASPGTTLTMGDATLRLYPAPGHTPDGLFTVITRPSEPALFICGDYLSALEFPFVEDSPEAYTATLNLAAELAASAAAGEEGRGDEVILIPGHGPLAHGLTAIRNRIETDRRYLADLEKVISAGWRPDDPEPKGFTYRGAPIPAHLAAQHRANLRVFASYQTQPGCSE